MNNRLDIFNSLISDLGNLSFVLFGFSITLFTLLYSFIMQRRESLKENSDKIKSGNIDPLLRQRIKFAKTYITNMKRITKHLILTIIMELIDYLLCIIIKYAISDCNQKEKYAIGLSVFTLLILIYISIMMVLTIKDYSKSTKI
jgi:hypothetical protein